MPVLCPGHPQLPPQRGIITYRLSPNRLAPLAGAGHAAIFNTFRRSRAQFWYVVPPFVVAYLAMKWAGER
jgi:ubiquinol-cytochrome c reductase subunit 8